MKFDGWYTLRSGGDKVASGTVVSGIYTTLYAHYVYDADAFFRANPNYQKTKKAKTIPKNTAIEKESQKGIDDYKAAFKWNSYKNLFNKKGLEEMDYVNNVLYRAMILSEGVAVAGLTFANEGAELFYYYLYGSGGVYNFDAFPLLNDRDKGNDTFNSKVNSLMRELEKYMVKDQKITFVDRDTSKNHISFEKWTNLNAFFAMHGGAYGVSGSCTFDGTTYKMDLYFFLQDHYDFLYSDGHWQAEQSFFGLRIGELAYLVPYGYATPFEARGTFHSTIEWKKGQKVDLAASFGLSTANKSKLAKITRIK